MKPVALALLLVAAASNANAQAVDPALGKRLWMQCRACHALKPGEPPKAGPSLHGVFGAKAGGRPDFAYSPAMKASGVVWTDATLDRFIANPAKAMKGNRMGYFGMPDPKNRAALIAFMKAETR
ncbi:MAG: c-type cytochrome [Phenylobacterium sp.]|nr:c-type cytochrome [Phenylobacterium sp.]